MTAASRAGFAQEYPFESHFLDFDGHRYHYIDEGPGQDTEQGQEQGQGRGQTDVLLMVHGNPTWSFAWRNLIKALSANFRVVAVDHIGCGFSDKPRHYRYTLEQHVTNLNRCIEALDLQRITLFAHDWGGAIGMGAAGRDPQRFSRFVLFNTAAFRSTQIPFRIAVCRIPVLGAFAVRGLNAFCRSALWMAVADRARMTAAVKAGYLAPYNGWQNRQAVLRFVQDIPLSPRHPSFPTLVSIEESLEQFLHAPLLLVWGERDWCFTVDFLREFQRRFPKAKTLSLPNAGHYVFEDSHEVIIPHVKAFLESNPLGNVEYRTRYSEG